MQPTMYLLTVDAPGEPRSPLGISDDMGKLMRRASGVWADAQMSTSGYLPLTWVQDMCHGPMGMVWEAETSEDAGMLFRIEQVDRLI